MEFLTKNLALKIIAFVLALMFWFNVVTNKSYEHEFDVPFSLEAIPSELILTTPPPSTINVRLAGTGKQILAFLFKKPRLNYSASHFERGIYKVDLKPDDLHFDTEMHAGVVAVNNPEQLTLKFEALDQKKSACYSRCGNKAGGGLYSRRRCDIDSRQRDRVGPQKIYPLP